jgi:hypothetical protein
MAVQLPIPVRFEDVFPAGAYVPRRVGGELDGRPMTGGHPHRTVGGGNSARAGPLTPLVVRLLLKLRHLADLRREVSPRRSARLGRGVARGGGSARVRPPGLA